MDRPLSYALSGMRPWKEHESQCTLHRGSLLRTVWATTQPSNSLVGTKHLWEQCLEGNITLGRRLEGKQGRMAETKTESKAVGQRTGSRSLVIFKTSATPWFLSSCFAEGFILS